MCKTANGCNTSTASACQHLLRVQKALDQMNVQLHHAVTDITGQTGLAILDAILAGERDPFVLARLRDYRCKKSEAEIARSLQGGLAPGAPFHPAPVAGGMAFPPVTNGRERRAKNFTRSWESI
jgi:hypothetical protein